MATSSSNGSLPNEDGSVLIGSATVRAPGVCGELAQGVIGGNHFLVTCPVDFYSRVKVDLYAGKHGIEAPEGCEKTGAAVRRTLVQVKNAKAGPD